MKKKRKKTKRGKRNDQVVMNLMVLTLDKAFEGLRQALDHEDPTIRLNASLSVLQLCGLMSKVRAERGRFLASQFSENDTWH